MFKKLSLLVVAVVALFVVAGVVMAQEVANTETIGAVMEAAVLTTPVNVDNKVCPVTGNKMEKLGENTVEYNGKVYNLCSPMCKDEFLKDPDKYVAKVEEEMAKEIEVPAAEMQK